MGTTTRVSTSDFTIDAIGSPEPIAPTIDSRKVTIRPSGGGGLVGWQYRGPDATSPAVLMSPGEAKTWYAVDANVKVFAAGVPFVYAESVSGTLDMTMECEGG